MKIASCWLVFALLTSTAAFPDDKGTYEQLLDQNKLPELLSHLQKWERKEPQNPEVYVAYFNYYLRVGQKDGVSIDRTPKKNAEVLAITDPKTNKVIGYINPSTIYDQQSIAKALLKLNEGLTYGIDRLDMYFGKIHILNEVFDYKTAGFVLVEVLVRSKANGNKWLWSNNEPVKNGQYFLLNNIQDYYQKWLESGTEDGLESVRKACEVQINSYPKNIYAYNNIAYVYALQNSLETALTYFKRAEEINPKDTLVLKNIANTYVHMGRKDKAHAYYRKVAEYGTDEDKKFAKEMLEKP